LKDGISFAAMAQNTQLFFMAVIISQLSMAFTVAFCCGCSCVLEETESEIGEDVIHERIVEVEERDARRTMLTRKPYLVYHLTHVEP
jgi:hypothetical protein